MNNIKLGLYKHYKGNIYKVLNVGIHTETMEEMVVYQDVNAPDKIWIRPASMWNDEINIDGNIVKRFQIIE